MECLFAHWVTQVVDQLKKMDADHDFQWVRLSAAFAFAVVRSDQCFQLLPRDEAIQSLKKLRSSGSA